MRHMLRFHSNSIELDKRKKYNANTNEKYFFKIDAFSPLAEVTIFSIFEVQPDAFFAIKGTLWLGYFLLVWQPGVKSCLEVSWFQLTTLRSPA